LGTVGYSFLGDLNSDLLNDSFPAKDKFIYGLNVGLDVPFGSSKWALNVALNYLFAEIELEGGTGDALGVNPLQVKVGAVYRF
jgi:hypothetical protein